METMHNDLMELLQQALYAILVAVIPIITSFVVNTLKKVSASVETNEQLTWERELIVRAIEVVSQSVDYTAQTYVSALKHEGQWTPDTQKEAFNITKEKALSFMDEEMKEFIKVTYGDFDLWLDSKIEQMVMLNK